jgi:hypothetical protein
MCDAGSVPSRGNSKGKGPGREMSLAHWRNYMEVGQGAKLRKVVGCVVLRGLVFSLSDSGRLTAEE